MCWENFIKDQCNFTLVIILPILITISLESVWTSLGENWCWSPLGLKGLMRSRRSWPIKQIKIFFELRKLEKENRVNDRRPAKTFREYTAPNQASTHKEKQSGNWSSILHRLKLLFTCELMNLECVVCFL